MRVGHVLTRIGRRDESKPDPRRCRRADSARVRLGSGGWIRVRDLLDYDRDREAESSWPSYHIGYCFLADLSHDNKGRVVLSFPHYHDLVGQRPDDFGYMPDIYFRMS